jgi:hypothetical protein
MLYSSLHHSNIISYLFGSRNQIIPVACNHLFPTSAAAATPAISASCSPIAGSSLQHQTWSSSRPLLRHMPHRRPHSNTSHGGLIVILTPTPAMELLRPLLRHMPHRRPHSNTSHGAPPSAYTRHASRSSSHYTRTLDVH